MLLLLLVPRPCHPCAAILELVRCHLRGSGELGSPRCNFRLSLHVHARLPLALYALFSPRTVLRLSRRSALHIRPLRGPHPEPSLHVNGSGAGSPPRTIQRRLSHVRHSCRRLCAINRSLKNTRTRGSNIFIQHLLTRRASMESPIVAAIFLSFLLLRPTLYISINNTRPL